VIKVHNMHVNISTVKIKWVWIEHCGEFYYTNRNIVLKMWKILKE